MSNWLTLPCPAKLNLLLRINGQLPNGYHQLQTLFQLLDYGDQLSLRTTPNDIRLLTPIPGVPDADNLIVKAALMLKQHAQNPDLGCELKLEKILPMGGGIGGGSSDAATTLLGLNKLWKLDLPTDELANLGLQLGADVPVFVQGHSAWAEGVGEQLQPLELPSLWYLVVHPPVHVSTADIFGHPQLTRNSPVITIRTALDLVALGQEPNAQAKVLNDCQPVVEHLFPPVKQALQWLHQYSPAYLTGTGACVFAAFETAQQAQETLARMPDELLGNFAGFVAQGVNRSPVFSRLQSLD